MSVAIAATTVAVTGAVSVGMQYESGRRQQSMYDDARRDTAARSKIAVKQLRREKRFTLNKLSRLYLYNHKTLKENLATSMGDLKHSLDSAQIKHEFQMDQLVLDKKVAERTTLAAVKLGRAASGFYGGTNDRVIEATQQSIDEAFDLAEGQLTETWDEYSSYVHQRRLNAADKYQMDKSNLKKAYKQDFKWADRAGDASVLNAVMQAQSEISSLGSQARVAEMGTYASMTGTVTNTVVGVAGLLS